MSTDTPQPGTAGALAAVELLEAIVEDRGLLAGVDPELRQRLLIAAGRVSKPTGKERRALKQARQRKDKAEQREADRALLDRAGIRRLRENPIFQTPRRLGTAAPDAPPPPTLGRVNRERVCYVCRAHALARRCGSPAMRYASKHAFPEPAPLFWRSTCPGVCPPSWLRVYSAPGVCSPVGAAERMVPRPRRMRRRPADRCPSS